MSHGRDSVTQYEHAMINAPFAGHWPVSEKDHNILFACLFCTLFNKCSAQNFASPVARRWHNMELDHFTNIRLVNGAFRDSQDILLDQPVPVTMSLVMYD